MRDKIHQNPPSMRDFLYKTNPKQVFCCNFAAVLEKTTNRLSNFLPWEKVRNYSKLKKYTNKWF